jgi:hypothetical protein
MQDESEFTADEQRALAPFFTNLDRSVFGLKLPQEVAGALFSRYSRSTKSLRRTFFDEFLGDPELGLKDLLGAQTSASDDNAALKKARAFYDRVLVGYGDDSVAIGERISPARIFPTLRPKFSKTPALASRPWKNPHAMSALIKKIPSVNISSIASRKSWHRNIRRLISKSWIFVRHLLAADGADARIRRRVATDRASWR